MGTTHTPAAVMNTVGPQTAPPLWRKDLDGATLRFVAETGTSKIRGLHEQVTRRLGISIVSSRRPAGSLLPSEDELCAELGVSRTVVRSALKVLASKGLVKARPKVGTRVCDRTNWSMLDPEVLGWMFEAGADASFLRQLIEVRYLIEPAAAEFAAIRADDHHRQFIAESVADMQASVEDLEAVDDADRRFHDGVLVGAQNEMLEQIGSTIRTALNAARGLTNSLIVDGPRTAIPLHVEVGEAIARRDPQAARKSMEAIIERASHDLEQLLAAQREAPL